MKHQTYDYIIIGGGTAGCVLAHRLSTQPDLKIALLEAGGRDNYPAIHMPIGYGRTIHHPKLSWHLRTCPESGADHRCLPLPRGRVLGGSSSLNGMIYIRGHPQDYEYWAESGCKGWGWTDILPFFKRIEHYPQGDPKLHGQTGPMSITQLQHIHPTNEKIITAFIEHGLKPTDNFNSLDQEGVGLYHVNIKNGRRHSAAQAYLKPARQRKNLDILTHAHVQRILFDGRRACGIDYSHKGRNHALHANIEILLCAGAYHSPQILQLSGIGAAGHLKTFGIHIIHNNPQVGTNLQDHFMAPMSWELCANRHSYNESLSGWRLIINVLRYYLTRSGPMTLPAAQVGAFMKSTPILERPDLQFHGLAVAGNLEVASRGEPSKLTEYPGLTIGGAMLRPQSRGTVRITSRNPFIAPDICHNYLTHEADRALTIKAMHLTRKIVQKPSLAPLILRETLPGAQAHHDEDLLAFTRALGTTMYHPVGTCRMGADAQAVVDPELRVKGVQNLRVIDASIMPTLVSGNTHAATLAIAEKGAHLILKDI